MSFTLQNYSRASSSSISSSRIVLELKLDTFRVLMWYTLNAMGRCGQSNVVFFIFFFAHTFINNLIKQLLTTATWIIFSYFKWQSEWNFSYLFEFEQDSEIYIKTHVSWLRDSDVTIIISILIKFQDVWILYDEWNVKSFSSFLLFSSLCSWVLQKH